MNEPAALPPESDSAPAFSLQQAERALLTGLILGEEDWPQIVEQLAETDFSVAAHGKIYTTLKHMLERGDQPDPLSLQNELEQNGLLERVGGDVAIGRLVEDFAGSFNTLAYARIVRDRSLLRQIRTCASQIAQRATQPEGREVESLLTEAQQAFFRLSEQRSGAVHTLVPLGEAVARAEKHLMDLSSGLQMGIQSGFPDLDKTIQGFHKGDLVILAARPSVGKTAFALELVRAAITQRQSVLMFSLEMSVLSIAQRLLSMEARVDGKKLLSGNMSDKDWNKIRKAKERLSDWGLLLDDTPSLKMGTLASRARRALHDQPDIGMIIVDYLQLVQGENQESRVQEVSSVSRALKGLAREMNVPLIALSQLSRAVEKDAGGKKSGGRSPRMSDLRDSGTIEQDADLVIFLHRAQPIGADADGINPLGENFIKVIVEKHRNGPTGYAELQFLSEYVSFLNVPPQAADN